MMLYQLASPLVLFLYYSLGARELTKIVAGYRDRAKTPLGDVTVIGEMGGRVFT